MKPDAARAAMIERLRSAGSLRSPAVQEAMASVPRHHFIEGVRDDAAYADVALAVKRTDDGTTISSLSQPTIVAIMLELCHLELGHRVLEIGTGTGYNTALLASIVGPDGLVVSIELEDDLAAAARERLRRHGFVDAVVLTGDGAEGYLPAAPFDRVIVTTGAAGIAEAWVEQLRDGGRLVTPVVDADGRGEVHCLLRRDGTLEELATVPCGFLPMRSA